ncbi:MAG TPA: aldehyde dehydrogenase family protein [Vulgatibacter sp.]|nr:aldehyde dehydrogenase family protein [Vulgatibacter sp.]
MLLGTNLVRAGRGRAAFRATALFVVVFALTVQYFLLRWPGWMYSYLIPETDVRLGWLSPAFFAAVLGAGLAGATVSLHLIRAGRMALAALNVLLGIGAWIAIWIVTWDRYFHLGDYASYHAGLAIPVPESAPFTRALNVVGAIQGIVGLACAVWIVFEGRRARRSGAVQPDPAPIEWRDAGAAAPRTPPPPSVVEGGLIRGIRPIDGTPLELVPVTPLSEIDGIVRRARDAQREWALRPVSERADAIRAAGKRLLARAEEAAAILEEENGRPRAESYLSEIVPSADLFSFWARKGALLLQGTDVPIDPLTFPGKRGVVERVPRGVVGAITPWNFPLMLPLRTVVPALLAGNAVVLKPSEHGARAGAFLGSLFDGLLPPHLLAVVQGGGEEAQAILSVGLDALVFIGSPRTGRAVARACADTLTPLVLELGGKDAAIVLEDADLDRTVNGVVWGAFANAGQNCAAIERCYVLEGIADAFIARAHARIATLRTGWGGEGEVDVGPLTTPSQKAIVDAQLREAAERGVVRGRAERGPRFVEVEAPEGSVVVRGTPVRGTDASGVEVEGTKVGGTEVPPAGGGEVLAGAIPPGDGLQVAPHLVVDPPEDLALVREETFGPILPIFRVRDEEEAIRRANSSPYGLTVSVWSRDLRRAERIGRRIHAGVITVNNHAFTGGLAQAPWGGVRGSGFGVTNSPQMLEELTRPRFVLVDRSKAEAELWWYPYDAGVLRLARGLTRLRSGEFGALGDVLGGFLARRRATGGGHARR